MSNFDKHVLAFFPPIYASGQFKDYRVLEKESISDILLDENGVISFRDYLGLSNTCSLRMTLMTSSVKRTNSDFKISVALIVSLGITDLLLWQGD